MYAIVLINKMSRYIAGSVDKSSTAASSNNASSNWENEFEKVDMPQNNGTASKVSVSANYKYTPIDDTAAREKVGNAKAISSDMYFQVRHKLHHCVLSYYYELRIGGIQMDFMPFHGELLS